MRSHAARFRLLVGLVGLLVVASAVLFGVGAWTDTTTAVLGTALSLTTIALVDASRVEARRRDPRERAIDDDKAGL